MIRDHGHAVAAGESRALVHERPIASALVGQVLMLIVAAVFILMGGLALIRAGLDGDMATPVVSVAGFTHTAWLGFLELFVGVLFLLSGISPSTRDLGLGVGVVLLLAGILVIAEPTKMPSELALEKSYGWLLVVLSVAAIVAGILPNGRVRRWSRVDAQERVA